MTSKIPLNVTYSVTKMVRTEVEIDLDDFKEWLEDDKISDDNAREYLMALTQSDLAKFLGEDYQSSIEDIYIENVEVCTYVV